MENATYQDLWGFLVRKRDPLTPLSVIPPTLHCSNDQARNWGSEMPLLFLAAHGENPGCVGEAFERHGIGVLAMHICRQGPLHKTEAPVTRDKGTSVISACRQLSVLVTLTYCCSRDLGPTSKYGCSACRTD